MNKNSSCVWVSVDGIFNSFAIKLLIVYDVKVLVYTTPIPSAKYWVETKIYCGDNTVIVCNTPKTRITDVILILSLIFVDFTLL